MKQGQETNQIWTQEAGTHDTQQNPDIYILLIFFYMYKDTAINAMVQITCDLYSMSHKNNSIWV